jgi:hypothetical protein
MNDLLKINDELSAFLKDFVELVATNDQCDVSLWLQEKGIEGKNEIVLLKKYLQVNFQLYRKIWMEEGYEQYWKAKELSKNKFRKADAELTLIIRTIGSKP